MSFVWTFPATVDSVTDGDTVICHVQIHPGEGGDWHGVHVRVEGINALELSQQFGGEAKAYAQKLLPAGSPVTLVARKREKYGRFLARIILADGRDFSNEMLVAKASDNTTPLAVPYLT